MTEDELKAVVAQANRKVGNVVTDIHGNAYTITDVHEGKIRVLSNTGVPYLFDSAKRLAFPVKKKAKKYGE
jgi:hypothetical protein